MKRAYQLGWIVSLGVVGCTGGESSSPPAAPGQIERLSWNPLPDDAAPRSSRVSFDWHASAARPDWNIDAARWDVREIEPEGSDPIHALVLEGEEGLVVKVPGPFEPDAFDRVTLVLSFAGSLKLQVRLERGSKTKVRSGFKSLLGKGRLVEVEFDLPELNRVSGAMDALSIAFDGPARPVGLVAVRLEKRPLTAWLPSPRGPANLIFLGEEGRRGVGLSSEQPLELDCVAPPGSQLSFAFGNPTEVRRGRERKTLRVTVSDETGPRLDVDITLDGDEELAWRSRSISLDNLAGRNLQVRFELVVRGEGEAVCALGEPILERREPDARTVVLVTSDTHRADHLGVADRGVDVATPFLDSLAARGVRFADCTAPTNLTIPSHSTLMTGVPPRDTGIVTNHQLLSEQALTLAERFRDAGYVTCCAVSAAKLHHERSGLGQGFDRMFAPEAAQVDSRETIARLADSLDEVEGLPLFVWLHLFDAHSPYEPPSPFDELYYPEDRDPRDPELPLLPRRARPSWDPDVRDADYVVALYKGEVTYLDESLRLLLARPRFQDGILAFTADHGESLTGHEVRFRHSILYPSTLDVPLLLAWPGAPAGTVVERAVELADLGRTILDLAGLHAVEFPGRNLLAEPAKEEDAQRPRFAIASNGDSVAVRVEDWYLVLHLSDDNPHHRALHAVELYDLAADPECLHDVIDQGPEQAGSLRQLVVDWLAATGSDRWVVDLDVHETESLQQLAALGYTTDLAAGQSRLWLDPECACGECARFR